MKFTKKTLTNLDTDMSSRKKKGFTSNLGFQKFTEILKKNDIQEILDIGCGKEQPHAQAFRKNGFKVLTCDFYDENDYQGMFHEIDFDRTFPAIWCAHCLEHQENVGIFLRKINSILDEGGFLCITVPPLKHKIVGGHLTLWNIGLLYYNLILAGFDCSKAIHKKYGYNLSVIVKKKEIKDMPKLKYDQGDIETLNQFFPFTAVQGFEGDKLGDTF